MRKILWALGTILLGASIAWGQACGSLVVNPVTGQLDCIGTNGTGLLPPPSGNTGDVPFMNGTGALQVDHGNFQYVLGSPNTFKAPSFFFGGGLTGLISNTQGADVACATTIAPTSQIGRLTGTGTVTTITPPAAFTVGGGNGTGGIVTLIPTAACTFATGGNITLPAGFTATPNAPIAFIYMSTQNTWWAIQETGTVTSVADDGAGHFTITNPTTTPTLTFVGQANDYSFSQINGSLGVTQLPASGLRLPVGTSPGAGPPAGNCVANVNYYLDSTNTEYYDCVATNTWKKVLETSNSGVGNIVLLNGANPCGSVTASNDCLSFNASDNLTWKDSAAATHLTGNFTSAPAGGSCVQTSGTTGLLVETGSACGSAGLPAGPTTPNGVAFDLTSTPSGGVAGAATWSFPGVPVDAQSGATYTVAATDRVSLVNTTNNTTSTAVTVPQAGTTNFANSISFVHCNSGTVVATDTPTTSTVNGNATLKLLGDTAGGNPECSFWWSNNTNYFAAEILPTDANGHLQVGAESTNAVTAASNFTNANLVQAAGANKTTSDSGIATANVVTAAANYTNGDLVQAAGANKTTSDSGVVAANVVTAAVAPGAAGQVCTAGAASKTCAYISFPQEHYAPAVDCVNAVAGSAWSTGATPAALCRAGTNNQNGLLSPWGASDVAYIQFHIDKDTDLTTTLPYLMLELTSTDATNAHTIIMQESVACAKEDGSTTDDVAFNAARSLSTITLNGNANRTWQANLRLNSTDLTGCAAPGLMWVKISRTTDTATNVGVYGLNLTTFRNLVVQAN